MSDRMTETSGTDAGPLIEYLGYLGEWGLDETDALSDLLDETRECPAVISRQNIHHENP